MNNGPGLQIFQVDAFAEEVFKGNPAAVIPLDYWLEEDVMQKIAMENNLSETAFFVKNEEAYHLRWFTPSFEIDLCGHATLASAYVIKNFLEPHLHTIEFSTEKAGNLKTYVSDGLYTLDFPARMPEPCEPWEGLMNGLGITTAVEILKSRDYFVVLPDEQAVLNADPDFSLLKNADSVGIIITAKGKEADVVSRCFYPSAGIPEDPVTGSAHCNIVPYWCRKLNKTKLNCWQASARGGKLLCELKEEKVLMAGHCSLFMKGEIFL